jgi:hypothetical protein
VELLARFLDGERLDREELKELEKFLVSQLDLIRKEK